MKTLTLVLASGLLATSALAQAPSTPPSNPPAPAMTATPGTTPSTGVPAAAGDRNQAVATTSENATQPAKGANSFTDGEARRRIESSGYSTVADLKKDDDGIWRGNAMKDGAKVDVWLDYKGNIGQQ